MAKRTLNRKAVNNNDNDCTSLEDKKYKLLDEYFCYKLFRSVPLSERKLEELCLDIIQWASTDEKALRVEEYYLNNGISRQAWLRWLDRFPSLAESYRQAKEIIGMRAYKKAFNRVGSESLLRHMQHQYDPAWKDAEDYQLEIRKKLNDIKQSIPTTVIVKTVEYDEE